MATTEATTARVGSEPVGDAPATDPEERADEEEVPPTSPLSTRKGSSVEATNANTVTYRAAPAPVAGQRATAVTPTTASTAKAASTGMVDITAEVAAAGPAPVPESDARSATNIAATPVPTRT